MDMLTWRAIIIDWRQIVKSPLVEMSSFKLVIQQTQVYYDRCKDAKRNNGFTKTTHYSW